MQEPRLTANGSCRQLADGMQVGGAPLQHALALLDRYQLEAYLISGSALSEYREIGFADDGDFGVAANGGGVRH